MHYLWIDRVMTTRCDTKYYDSPFVNLPKIPLAYLLLLGEESLWVILGR